MFGEHQKRLNGRTICVLVLLFLFAGSVAEGAERRRSKVIFSDSKESATSTVDIMQPERRVPPTEALRRSSSLDGVAAPPFAPPTIGPESFRPLTVPRRAPDDNKDWLIRSVVEMNAGGDAAAKALGVRDSDPTAVFLFQKDSEKAALTKEGTFLGAAADDADGQKPNPKLPKPDVTSRLDGRSPLRNTAVPGYTGVTKPGGVQSDSRLEPPTPVIFSDTGDFPVIGKGGLEGLRGTSASRTTARSALDPVDTMGAFGVLRSSRGGNDTVLPKPRDEFRQLLGLEKQAEAMPSQRELIGGASDYVNTKPDLTRQEVNPVTPRPFVGTGTSPLPSFRESQVATVQPNTLKLPEIETLPSRAFGPALPESSLAPVTDIRKRTMSPTVLPVPKRTF